MPNQMNHEGSSKGKYKLAGDGSANIKHAQSNFDGGRTTLKAGSNRSRQQTNFTDGSYGSPGKRQAGSHFGEKGGTGCNGGY
jgi:hypothetical protein